MNNIWRKCTNTSNIKFKISAGIGQRKTLMVQESKESFSKLFEHLVLKEKETESN